MNERAAIDLCLRHEDPRGFEYLVEKYRREAYYHAISLLGNREDAADACQESFTRAFVALRRLPQLTQFYPWFYRILRNCCLNVIARRKTAVDHRPEQAQGPAGPLEILERSDEEAFVWKVLRSLKPEFREILILKYVDGCSYAGLAERLDIPRGTVMSRLYYARRSFRDRYVAMEADDA